MTEQESLIDALCKCYLLGAEDAKTGEPRQLFHNPDLQDCYDLGFNHTHQEIDDGLRLQK